MPLVQLQKKYNSLFSKLKQSGLLKNRVVQIVIATIFIVALGITFDYKNSLNKPLVLSQGSMAYTVASGSNLTRIVYDLADKGLIENPRYLLLYAKLQGPANKISTGEYQIKHGMTAQNFLDQILSGKVIQYTLTIIEGWNIYQLLDAIKTNPHIMQTLDRVDEKNLMAKLGYPNLHPEGRFLSDTYHFPRGTTDVQFLQRAYQAMEKYLTLEWDKRTVGLPYKTPYDALIMASIVEKETGLASERQQIAGVFVRRLEKRMRLQTDPTVIYGLGKKFDGNIRRRDLKNDTPYNTYRRFGLPPTPIAMPSKDAIYAALHPAEGESLYFVSRGDGSHYFSSTLDEHNQAVIKYQLKGRKRSFSSYNARTNSSKK